MKYVVLVFVAFIISCNKNTPQNIESKEVTNDTLVHENKLENATQSHEIALQFINDYLDFSFSNVDSKNVDSWINENVLVTTQFKDSFKKIVENAYKEDPELGLDYDPILCAQDFPDAGFELYEVDKDGYVIVRDKVWKDFKVILKMKNSNNTWFVDGCGNVNIPDVKRIKR